MNESIYSIERVTSWASQIRSEAVAASAANERLVQELETLTSKDAALNERLVAARNQGQNLRPIYILCRSLMLERARVFRQLSLNSAQRAVMCRQSVDTFEKLFGVTIKKAGES